jgi:hypothetical protein
LLGHVEILLLARRLQRSAVQVNIETPESLSGTRLGMWVNEQARTSQEETIHPLSSLLFQAWEGMRGTRSAPSRHDLDLKQLRKLVPNLFIAEQAAPAQEFRWRLAGTAICALLGREVTGSALTDGWDAFEGNVIRRFLAGVSGTHQPALLRLRFTTDRGQHIMAEVACFPMMAADGTSTQVLGGLFIFPDAELKHYDALTARELVSARFASGEPVAAPREEVMVQARRKFRVIAGGLG